MASNGLQPGFEDAPAFSEEDAPAAGADLEEVARYALWRGAALKGTRAQRLAFSAAPGDLWSDTTEGALYRWTGATWIIVPQTLASAFNGSGTGQTFNVTPTDLTSLAFTLTLPAAANVMFRIGMQVFTDSLNAGVQIDIYDGASSIRTVFASANGIPGAAGASNVPNWNVPVVGMASGSHAIKLRATRTGSGTLTFPHTALHPSFLIAETF